MDIDKLTWKPDAPKSRVLSLGVRSCLLPFPQPHSLPTTHHHSSTFMKFSFAQIRIHSVLATTLAANAVLLLLTANAGDTIIRAAR